MKVPLFFSNNPVLKIVDYILLAVLIVIIILIFRLFSLINIYLQSSELKETKKSRVFEADFKPFIDDFLTYGQKEQVQEKKVMALDSCFRELGFNEFPKSESDIKNKFKKLAKTNHPDRGGNEYDFIKLNEAYKKAIEKYKERIYEKK